MTWVNITHYSHRSIRNKYLTFHKLFGLVFNSCMMILTSSPNEGIQLTQLIIKKTPKIIRSKLTSIMHAKVYFSQYYKNIKKYYTISIEMPINHEVVVHQV